MAEEIIREIQSDTSTILLAWMLARAYGENENQAIKNVCKKLAKKSRDKFFVAMCKKICRVSAEERINIVKNQFVALEFVNDELGFRVDGEKQ